MEDYEIITDNIKIKWHENFDIKDQRYTQVSAFIYNDKDELLIVKNETWTLPGGHPEEGETKEETLRREVMEETCSTIKDLHYIGAVEVIEDDETYYQLRYTARLDQLLEYKPEFEVSERKLVSLEDLYDYVIWGKGITFQAQLASSKKVWGIETIDDDINKVVNILNESLDKDNVKEDKKIIESIIKVFNNKKYDNKNIEEIEKEVNYLEVKYDEFNDLSYYVKPLLIKIKDKLHKEKVKELRNKNREKRGNKE